MWAPEKAGVLSVRIFIITCTEPQKSLFSLLPWPGLGSAGLPFILGTSSGKSFSVHANVQQTLSMLQSRALPASASGDASRGYGGGGQGGADGLTEDVMDSEIDFVINSLGMWAATFVAFPVFVAGGEGWGWVWAAEHLFVVAGVAWHCLQPW